MAAPVTVPARPLTSRSVSGVLSLTILLLCALAAAAVFTAYLLRTAVTHQAANPAPAPYWIWYQQGTRIRAMSADGRQQRTVLSMPTAAQGVAAFSVAPDGQRRLLVAMRDTGAHAWLLPSPGTVPLALPLPGAAQ